MKQFIYKTLVVLISIVLIYEFTIGKLINKYTNKLDTISTKEGRKEIKKEIKKGVEKERYLSKEDAKLLNQFIKKIQKELK